MESAVKTMHGLASDQAAKYRGDMKKVMVMMTMMLSLSMMKMIVDDG